MRWSRVPLYAALLLAYSATQAPAADREFDHLASAASSRFAADRTHIPMMGFVSFCARVATGGGVKILQVAEFDNLDTQLGLSELTSLFHETLNSEWTPFVTESSRKGGEQSVIFVRPVGKVFRMLIAEYEHGELDLVEIELNAKALAKWMRDPDGEARRRKNVDLR